MRELRERRHDSEILDESRVQVKRYKANLKKKTI
jgi:hypothetical protein